MFEELKAIRERHSDWEEIGFVRMGPNGAILAHKDRATLLSLLTASEARAEAAEARVGELEEALLQHNERLRSAIAVADRNGAETNWKAFRGELHYTAAEYHELVNSIRTLKGAPDGR